jgi:hypothetical protein
LTHFACDSTRVTNSPVRSGLHLGSAEFRRERYDVGAPSGEDELVRRDAEGFVLVFNLLARLKHDEIAVVKGRRPTHVVDGPISGWLELQRLAGFVHNLPPLTFHIRPALRTCRGDSDHLARSIRQSSSEPKILTDMNRTWAGHDELDQGGTCRGLLRLATEHCASWPEYSSVVLPLLSANARAETKGRPRQRWHLLSINEIVDHCCPVSQAQWAYDGIYTIVSHKTVTSLSVLYSMLVAEASECRFTVGIYTYCETETLVMNAVLVYIPEQRTYLICHETRLEFS